MVTFLATTSIRKRRLIMDSRYRQEVQKYGKNDAIHALCVYLAIAILVVIQWFIRTNYDFTGILSFVDLLAMPIIVIVVVFTIVIVKKQGLASIGFHKQRMLPTLTFGLLIALILLVFGIAPGLVYGWEFNNIGAALIPILLRILILAAFEDILFVGYLQTRIYGLIKKDVPAIFVVAVLFAVIHIPVGLLGGMTIGSDLILALIGWAMAHLLLVLIFRKQFSLIPVFVAHTLINFFRRGELWVDFNPYYNEYWIITAEFLVLLLLVIFGIVKWRRSKHVATT